jgi:transglutaminase-like putative cysteine protease
LHARVSVFCPGRGWIDLATNDVLADPGHVPLTIGRHHSDVSLLQA